MKIGCLTLAFNQGLYLQTAINSVISQNKVSEYYIYNPGSTDNTSEVLDKNRSMVTEIYVESDLGPSDGLNAGLEKIQSDIFYYLNADDRVVSGAFSYVTTYFSENPYCDVLHGSINVIDRNDQVIRTLPAMNFTLRGYALGYSVVYQQATFFRRQAIPKAAFNVDNRISWDGELIVDLAMGGAKIHQTQTILGEFRIYSESITGSGRYVDLAKKEHARIARKILGRNPRAFEKIFAFLIRKFRAIKRRINPQIEYIES